MARETVHRIFIDDGGHSAIFKDELAAHEEAKLYLRMNPDAIVMMVELELDECKHCRERIIEKAGWIIHKWVHLHTGAHLCLLRYTQAEPAGALL